jgi:hypothetical protein
MKPVSSGHTQENVKITQRSCTGIVQHLVVFAHLNAMTRKKCAKNGVCKVIVHTTQSICFSTVHYHAGFVKIHVWIHMSLVLLGLRKDNATRIQDICTKHVLIAAEYAKA